MDFDLQNVLADLEGRLKSGELDYGAYRERLLEIRVTDELGHTWTLQELTPQWHVWRGAPNETVSPESMQDGLLATHTEHGTTAESYSEKEGAETPKRGTISELVAAQLCLSLTVDAVCASWSDLTSVLNDSTLRGHVPFFPFADEEQARVDVTIAVIANGISTLGNLFPEKQARRLHEHTIALCQQCDLHPSARRDFRIPATLGSIDRVPYRV